MLGLQRFAVATQLFRRAAFSSSARGTAATAATATSPKQTPTTASGTTEDHSTLDSTDVSNKRPRSSMVAAAFKSLTDDSNTSDSVSTTVVDSLDERIINAKTVNGLLSLSDSNGPISRKHALKIVSILAEWSSIKRVKISEFENDTRFIRICRVLGRSVSKNINNVPNKEVAINGNGDKRITGFRTDDLNTVLGVAGDDEAAKLIASISPQQMVKVMSTLAQRKRRSTPLLRSLAFNISSSTDRLDLKQCADVLYAMATLNFKDSVLAAKLCGDIQEGLPKNVDKSAVIGSILTSLGILKYRDLDMMESLTQWTLKNSDICRPQDLSALFHTSATLNFKSTNIEDVRKKLVQTLVRNDFNKPVDWLNHVWALALLGLAEHSQLETVLSSEFVKQLQADRLGLSPTSKMKILNINSISKLFLTNYKGPSVPEDSVVFDVPMAHSKSKQILLNAVLDALKNLLPTRNHVRSLVDSKMGFLIDAYCLFDAKRNPLPHDKEHPNAIKVAIMVVDFNDVCHGPHRAASGITNLSFDLLEKSGFKVIPVPYNEFNTSDKLLKRVQYLEAKFKAIVSSTN